MADVDLTMDTVGKMSTYELRQEVDKRGLLGELKSVNHNTLLRKLVQIVVEEERKRGQQTLASSADPRGISSGVNLQERIRSNKEERKAAAVERSELRQADQDYFHQMKLCNIPPNSPRQEVSSPVEGDDVPEVSETNPHGYKVFVR